MPRKESITQEMLLCAALSIARKEGMENVTARKLANEAGCSTQPIFRIYRNMEELQEAVFQRSADYFSDFYGSFPQTHETPFTDLAMAYISFARKEENLFRMLFLNATPGRMSTYELVNGREKGFIRTELSRIQGLTPSQAEMLFSRLWVFIHGMACMALCGDFDLTAEETIQMVENAFESFRDNLQKGV